jgi:hypothetical protein
MVRLGTEPGNLSLSHNKFNKNLVGSLGVGKYGQMDTTYQSVFILGTKYRMLKK